MVRPSSSIGRKWNAAFVAAIDDAVEAYGNALPGLATKIIAQKSTAKTNYGAALDSASYDSNVRSGLAPGVADVNFEQRLAQIEVTGFTTAQQQKLVSETEVRRHMSTLIDGIVTAADGSGGNLALPNVSNAGKRQIVNAALMQLIRNFSTTTTVNAAVAVLKSNATSLNDISVA